MIKLFSYLSMKNSEHACNRFWNVVTVSGTITVLPIERYNVSRTISVTLSGTVSVTPNLHAPITTLNHHVTAIATPNDASLQTLTISHFVPHVT